MPGTGRPSIAGSRDHRPRQPSARRAAAASAAAPAPPPRTRPGHPARRRARQALRAARPPSRAGSACGTRCHARTAGARPAAGRAHPGCAAPWRMRLDTSTTAQVTSARDSSRRSSAGQEAADAVGLHAHHRQQQVARDARRRRGIAASPGPAARPGRASGRPGGAGSGAPRHPRRSRPARWHRRCPGRPKAGIPPAAARHQARAHQRQHAAPIRPRGSPAPRRSGRSARDRAAPPPPPPPAAASAGEGERPDAVAQRRDAASRGKRSGQALRPCASSSGSTRRR